MHLSTILSILFLLITTLIVPSHSAKSTATSFCKCICFNNSTIIALNPPSSPTSSSSIHNLAIRFPRALDAEDGNDAGSPKDDSAGESPARPQHRLSCADCTRAFCLDYNLPICKDAREEDVFTSCFQRDSLKDETVVVLFIIVTAGLLTWAVVKPWFDRLRERRNFLPLAQHDQGRGGTGPARSTAGGRNVKAPRNNNGFLDGAGGNASTGAMSGEEEPFTVGSYDEDVHADQHAVDIASDAPSRSGPGSNPRFHS